MIDMTLPEIAGKTGLYKDGDWIESKDQDPNGDVRLIQMMDIAPGRFLDKSQRFLTSDTAERLRCTYLKEGDVLVSRMPDPIGRACVFPGDQRPCVTAVDVCIVRPDPKMADATWLMYMINTGCFRSQIEKWITGTTRSRISRGNLGKIKLQVPPILEQKRIAAILDKAEAIRRKRAEAIRLADDFLKSAFLDMFGDPVTNPKGWDRLPLKKLTSKIGSGATPRGGSKSYKTEGISLIRSLNIHDDDFRMPDLAFIDESQAAALDNVIIESQDVLLNITGASVCRCAMVPDEVLPARVNQHVAILRTIREKILPEFLLHQIISHTFKQDLLRMATSGGATREALTKKQLQELHVCVPPPDEQEIFCSMVRKMKHLVGKQIEASQEQDELFSSLMGRAFSGRLT